VSKGCFVKIHFTIILLKLLQLGSDARRQTPDASRLLVTVEPYFYLKTAQTFVDAGLDQDSPQPIAELMRSF
jgi:hypothetical protein